MAIGDIKTFDIVDVGLELTINAIDVGGGKVRFEIKAVEGFADLAALYWNNGNDVVDGGANFNVFLNGANATSGFANMQGSGEVWDGGIKLSPPGLDTGTFLEEGDSYLVPTDVMLDFEQLTTIGIRAQETSTEAGSIKGVDDGEDTPPPLVCVKGAAVDGEGEVTVLDDGVEVDEGEAAAFVIKLDQAYLYDVVVAYKTVSGSAEAGDYQEKTGLVTIAAGALLSEAIYVQTNQDDDTDNETFSLQIESVTIDIPGDDITSPDFILCAEAQATIIDDDTGGGGGGGGEEPPTDYFPEFNGLSHVTLYFKASELDDLSVDTRGAGKGKNKGPDGWFTVKFETGQLGDGAFDLDDHLDEFLDLLVASGKIGEDETDKLLGVSLHDGSLKKQYGDADGNMWFALDDDTTPDDVPDELAQAGIYPILASNVDVAYSWSGTDWV